MSMANFTKIKNPYKNKDYRVFGSADQSKKYVKCPRRELDQKIF